MFHPTERAPGEGNVRQVVGAERSDGIGVDGDTRPSVIFCALGMAVALFVCSVATALAAEAARSAGQVVYVPMYSQVFVGPKSHPLNLSATLSIHNTDPKRPITVTSVSYYDTKGRLVKRYFEKSLTLGPLAVSQHTVRERDISGGPGANFIVEWRADRKVSAPIIEALLVSTKSGLGLSFLTTGKVIKELSP